MSNKIKDYKPTVRDDSYKLEIGVLVKPNNSLAFAKHGFMVVTEHKKEGRDNIYVLYSQKEQRYWELKCWLVNSFYSIESPNTEIVFPKSI